MEDKTLTNTDNPCIALQPLVRLPGARALVWFSCGAASAIAAKLSVQKWGDKCEVVYCDTSSDEHPDNIRFLRDIEQWIGKPITLLTSDYVDRWEVYEETRYLVGLKGARCTVELKKKLRFAYQRPDDLHIFGFTLEEKKRIRRLYENNPELFIELPLVDNQITKNDCYALLHRAGIELPAMYKLGYKNNNCIGCVKGQAGYWNKIRVDFPEIFERMARLERELNVACVRLIRNGEMTSVFLDELDPAIGNYESEPDISCNILCEIQAQKLEAV